MADYRDRPRNLGVHGPERDRIIDQMAARRNDLATQAAHQPHTADSALAGRNPTGTAGRATQTSGGSDEPSHLGEAEDAFERSGGDGADRGRPDR